MTQELKNRTSLSNSFIDESFDVKKTINYKLIVQISLTDVVVAVYDTIQKKYIALEKYAFQDVHSFGLIPNLLDVVYGKSKLLSNKYKRTTAIIANNLSTLVPEPLFEETKKEKYLTFNVRPEVDDEIFVDDLKVLEAKNIFAISSEVKKKLKTLFSDVKIKHSSSSFIENVLMENKNSSQPKLYVHVQNSYFEVALIKGKKLTFYNTFNYHTAEDFIYYLLFVCDQLQLNPETIDVVIVGEIERGSSMYSLAYKYIRNLTFGVRHTDAELSYQLQDLPKHFYFSLLSNHNG